jgi:antitoxin ParD1/3/4
VVLREPAPGDKEKGMNVSLRPELERFVAERISKGGYANPSEVVNEALEVFKEQEGFTPEHEAYLQREVQRGLDQLDAGECAVFDARTIIAEERRRGGRERE